MATDDEETGDITGRDSLVMTKALWYALKYIEGLPADLQEWSDQQDMKALLIAYFPGGRDLMMGMYSSWLKMIREHPQAAAEWQATSEERREVIRRHRSPPDILDEKRSPYFTGEAKPQ